MKSISEKRSVIYDHFHSSESCSKYFFDKAHGDEYAKYYTAMYLLQDSTEALMSHREVGFSKDPLLAYIELWGVLQAVVIQQDSITNIVQVLGQIQPPDHPPGTKWHEIRRLRVLCAGHPSETGPRGGPYERAFAGRSFGGYDQITIEVWSEKKQTTEHRAIRLGKLLDDYAREAIQCLDLAVQELPKKWP
jgi:hypothetical protein